MPTTRTCRSALANVDHRPRRNTACSAPSCCRRSTPPRERPKARPDQQVRRTARSPAPRRSTDSYDADIGFSAFEIDLFGRLRILSHAAQQQYLASEAAARAARLTLVAEVADAYLTLAADRSLLAVASETEASAARSVDLTQARLTGGIAPRTDLRQAQTVLDQAQVRPSPT